MNKHFKKFSASQKGFTIIELIVVIAIIAVLAAIVLVNVTQYINKGKDAAVAGNLSTMLTNSAVYYNDSTLGNGQYNSFYDGAAGPITTIVGCAGDTGFGGPCKALIDAGYNPITVTCHNSAATPAAVACNAPTTGDGSASVQGWCAMVALKAVTSNYCVDSSGAKANAVGETCIAGVCAAAAVVTP